MRILVLVFALARADDMWADVWENTHTDLQEERHLNAGSGSGGSSGSAGSAGGSTTVAPTSTTTTEESDQVSATDAAALTCTSDDKKASDVFLYISIWPAFCFVVALAKWAGAPIPSSIREYRSSSARTASGELHNQPVTVTDTLTRPRPRPSVAYVPVRQEPVHIALKL